MGIWGASSQFQSIPAKAGIQTPYRQIPRKCQQMSTFSFAPLFQNVDLLRKLRLVCLSVVQFYALWMQILLTLITASLHS
jgi:hypothetical protein